jgi:predicted acyl esterase
MTEKSEIRDGMRIDWDIPIEMEDGVVLRADVYRPIEEGQYPVIMTYVSGPSSYREPEKLIDLPYRPARMSHY